MRSVAALVAGLTAALAATGAALGLRRRKRAARRGERRQARRSTPSARAVTPAATPALAKVAAAESVPPAASDSTSAPTLRSIKGIGDVAERRLAEAGVTSVDQVAAWSDADVERVATRVRVSAERIRREDWVGQARRLRSDT